jgi:hypothetical protein
MARGGRRAGRNGRVATPTALAGFVKCEMQEYLRSKGEDSSTEETRAAAEAGTREHERWEAAGSGVGGAGGDRRCFVASWALGPDDEDTEKLRRWRDERLLGSAPGRLARDAYYAVSPVLIRLLAPIPGAREVSARVVRLISRLLTGGRP